MFAKEGVEQPEKFVTEEIKPVDEEKEVTIYAIKENQELLAESMIEEPNILGTILYHQLHLIIHRQLKNTPEYRMKKEEAKRILDLHIDKHETLLAAMQDRMNQIMQQAQQMMMQQEQPVQEQQIPPEMQPPVAGLQEQGGAAPIG